MTYLSPQPLSLNNDRRDQTSYNNRISAFYSFDWITQICRWSDWISLLLRLSRHISNQSIDYTHNNMSCSRIGRRKRPFFNGSNDTRSIIVVTLHSGSWPPHPPLLLYSSGQSKPVDHVKVSLEALTMGAAPHSNKRRARGSNWRHLTFFYFLFSMDK